MKHRSVLATVILTVVVALVGGLSWHHTQAAQKFVHSNTPTIFVHGWGSSYHAETSMANAAKHAGVTNTIVRANVDRNGHVTFNRSIPANAINPIVEVNLQDNKLEHYVNSSASNNYADAYHHGGTYILNVVKALEKQHHYSAINLVGHSMGNLEIANYINDNYPSSKLPKINHLVAIAGHYNGLAGQKAAEGAIDEQSGKPSQQDPGFTQLLGLREHFPTNTKVLNIYGNYQGKNSDGDVPINSAKTLKYLVSSRAKSYHELEIRGNKAQHSQLHNNNHQVNQALINFLWTK